MTPFTNALGDATQPDTFSMISSSVHVLLFIPSLQSVGESGPCAVAMAEFRAGETVDWSVLSNHLQ